MSVLREFKPALRFLRRAVSECANQGYGETGYGGEAGYGSGGLVGQGHVWLHVTERADDEKQKTEEGHRDKEADHTGDKAYGRAER